MAQLQSWLDMMTHGEFLYALLVVVAVAIAYGLAIPYLLWPLWSGAFDFGAELIGRGRQRGTREGRGRAEGPGLPGGRRPGPGRA